MWPIVDQFESNMLQSSVYEWMYVKCNRCIIATAEFGNINCYSMEYIFNNFNDTKEVGWIWNVNSFAPIKMMKNTAFNEHR